MVLFNFEKPCPPATHLREVPGSQPLSPPAALVRTPADAFYQKEPRQRKHLLQAAFQVHTGITKDRRLYMKSSFKGFTVVSSVRSLNMRCTAFLNLSCFAVVCVPSLFRIQKCCLFFLGQTK